MTAPPPPSNTQPDTKARSLLAQVIGALRKKRRPPQEPPPPDLQPTTTTTTAAAAAAAEAAAAEAVAAETVAAEPTASDSTLPPGTSNTTSKDTALACRQLSLPDEGACYGADDHVLLALADAPPTPKHLSTTPGTVPDASDAQAESNPLAFRPSLYRDAIAHQPPSVPWWDGVQNINPWFIALPLGAVVAVAAVEAGSGGAAASASLAELKVKPGLGPVIHSDNLAFRAYAIQPRADGGSQLQPLDNVSVEWNADGTAVIQLNGYKGLVMLSLYSTQQIAQIDSNFAGDYIDEATGKGTLLGGTVLRTIGVADSSNSLHLALSPLTETLVRILGFAPADNGATVLGSATRIDTTPDGPLRSQASTLASLCNTLLGLKDDDAKALSAESLLGFGGELSLAVDSSGYPVSSGDVHGQVLSLISSYQKKNNIGPSEAISRLAQEWAQLTPATATQSASFAALKELTQFSPPGSISLTAGFDTGYGSLKDAPASDNGTLTDNRTRYQQPQFDMTGLDKALLHTGDVLQVIDGSNNDAVINSYRIGSDTTKDDQVLTTGTLTAIVPIGQLAPGEHKLYAQVLSSTGIKHTSTTPLTVTIDTTATSVLDATLALDESEASDSSNAAQGGRGTNRDKVTNIRKPTVLVSGLSGKAFQVKDRIEILDTSVSNALVGFYYVQAGDLDASGNWASKTALDIQINQSLADVSDKTTKGIHNLIVSVTDSAGNYTSKPSTPQLTLTIDATAPIPTLQLPGTNGNGIKQDGLLNADRAVELKLSYAGMVAGDVARVFVNDKPLVVNGIEPYKHIISSSDVNANSIWTFSLSGGDFAKNSPVSGSNTVSVVVTDLAGNSSSTAASQSIWWGPPQLNLPGDGEGTGFTNGNWINASSSTVNLQLSKFGLIEGDQIVITDGNGHNATPYTLVSGDFVTNQDWVTIKGVARSEIGTGMDGSFNLVAQVKRNDNVVYTSTPVTVQVDTVAPVVDLNGSAAGNDTTTTITPASVHTTFSTNTRLFPLYAVGGGSGATVTDSIATIQLQFDLQSGLLKTGDRLLLGATDLRKDLVLLSGSNVNGLNATIEGIPNMDYSYVAASRTLSVHLHSRENMSPTQIQNLMLGFQFKNESVSGVAGTRDVEVHFLDAAGNDAFAVNQSLLHLVL
ncbi:MAG: hypothetical protein ORN29_03890 [Rhodoferax sp.]|nr:hypothetical protein [Rhodoferax sp.]